MHGGILCITDGPQTVHVDLPAEIACMSGRSDVLFPPSMAAQLTYADYLITPQHFITAVARLKRGVSFEQANAELRTIGGRFADEASPPSTVWGAGAVPIVQARIDADYRRSALVLLAGAACVLLTDCVNVAG